MLPVLEEPIMIERNVPAYCTKGSQLPRKKIFCTLRSEWLKSDAKRTSSKLAKMLSITPQAVSAYANESSNREAPWWILMRLAHELNLEIVLRSNEIIVKDISRKIGI